MIMLREEMSEILFEMGLHLFSCSQLGAAYVSATTGAVVTALGLKSLATVMPVVQVK